MSIELQARPHKTQKIVHDCTARFRVLASGRRWGKTRLGVYEALEVAFGGGRSWWVSPSYKMGAVGWRPLSRLAGDMKVAEVKYGERLITFPNGGSVQCRSADDPDSLRGEGLDFVVLDEASFMAHRTWMEALRPALSDRNGRALFISTPKGRNWFYNLYMRGQSNENNWRSFSYPTSDNPYIPDAEIEAAQKDLPERIFQQEYQAAFLDDAGGVFRRVMQAVNGSMKPEGDQYVIGCDWGRQNDATAFVVVELSSGIVVEIDRMTETDYQTQVMRLEALWQRYGIHTEIIAEYNSMGGPMVEALQNKGLPVSPFVTTNASKMKIIDGLSLAFERGDIHIPQDPTLIGELQAFESKRLPSGAVRYSAPDGSGIHDDLVMALALAWSAREDAQPIILMHA